MRWTHWACAIVLALSIMTPLALADSIDYSGSGSVANHTARIFGHLSVGSIWGVTDQLHEIIDLTTNKILAEGTNIGMDTVMTSTLFKCAAGLCFSSGMIDIDVRGKHHLDLDGTLTHGQISILDGFVSLQAQLGQNGGTILLKNPKGFVSTQTIAQQAPVVAEPGTLVLFGSGVVALGWKLWEKRKRNCA